MYIYVCASFTHIHTQLDQQRKGENKHICRMCSHTQQIQHEEDRQWTPDHRETPAEMAARGVAFLKWLSGRDERTVAVVTHSALLLTLFTQVLHCRDEELTKWFENGEMRSVTLQF